MKYKMYSMLLVTLVLSGYQCNAWSQSRNRLVINSLGFDDCPNCETRLAVDLSQSPVPILFSPSGAGYGIYLRWNNRPLMGNCPASGTSLEEGSMMLDRYDGFTHPLRSYSTRLISWNMYDPAFEMIGSYYFHGCMVDHVTRQFTGQGTNQVEVEVVDKLPDLVLRNSMLYRGGPQGGGGVFLVTEKEFRSDLSGVPFKYKVYVRPGYETNTLPPAEIVFDGEAMLVPGTGTVIEIPAGRIPRDGRHYTVMISINEDKFISESTHSNNFKAINWQVETPVTLSFTKLRVHGNCDYRSPGEWEMLMRIMSSGLNQDSWKVTYNMWGLDVEDNTNYPINPDQKGFFNVELANHPLENSLVVQIAFEDCNSTSCGEEFRERLGRHDSTFTGWIRADLTPEDRRNGVPAIETSDNTEHCGFTAELKLMDPATARSEGYEAHVRCGSKPDTYCKVMRRM